MTAFIDREHEMAELESVFRSGGAQLLVLYGRRRVGKTELLREFCDRHRSVFFVADQRAGDVLLREFSALLWRTAGQSVSTAPAFPGWAEALQYAGSLARSRRLVLVIDEFPYLAAGEAGFASVLQRVWDAELSGTKLVLILCGSAVAYMEGEVLSRKSPLFGRRSGQLLLQPMRLPEVKGFWPGLAAEDAIRAYAVVGGIPAYATRWDSRHTVAQNIREALLHKTAYLYEEVPYLLMQELRQPRVYMAVLQAIAGGRTTQNQIAQAAGLRGGQVAPYLRTLADLHVVERTVPVQERHPHKSRKGRYRIRDPFFRFWFRFVFPNRSRLEQGLVDQVWESDVSPRLDEHVSLVFEDLARDHLWRLAREGELPLEPVRIGAWRDPAEEVELVTVSEKPREILVAECKWSRRKVGLSVLTTLQQRGERLARVMGAGRFHVGLFSRSGFTSALEREARRSGALLVDPTAMVSRPRKG